MGLLCRHAVRCFGLRVSGSYPAQGTQMPLRSEQHAKGLWQKSTSHMCSLPARGKDNLTSEWSVQLARSVNPLVVYAR